MIQLLVAAVLASGGQDASNEAEKLFRKFESRMRNAKSIALMFDGKLHSNAKDDETTVKGSMRLKPEDRLAIDVTLGGGLSQKMTVSLRSDGTKTIIVAGGKTENKETDKGISKFMMAALARSGVGLLHHGWRGKEVPNPDEFFQVSNFRMKPQKRGYLITYTLKMNKIEAEITLLLDYKTLNPMRRSGKIKDDNETKFREYYTKVYINEIPDGDFDHK